MAGKHPLAKEVLVGCKKIPISSVQEVGGKFLKPSKFKTLTGPQKKIAQRTLAEIDAKLKEKQIEVNIAEAKHKSLFVAGWRPFIGWISASALAFNFTSNLRYQFSFLKSYLDF